MIKRISRRIKDKNGKVLKVGDKVSFDGRIADVVWLEDQGRMYFKFNENLLFEAAFYSFIHEFEILE